ncbi:MAG: molybdopterin dinucleotide binding domain-containing protein [Porticoccaceae bacterium]
MPTIEKSTCRSCAAYCPVDVTLEGGKVLRVEGNKDAPLYKGFICPKGRALAAMHNNPARLRGHLKRRPDGSFAPISSEQLVAEVSDRLADITARRGPRAVAAYLGSPGLEHQALGPMMIRFMGAIGSPNLFNNGTIDQPGLMMAPALHGGWAGGRMHPDTLDVFVLFGGNPVISKQYFPQNPGDQLKRLTARGMKLIVIDPRRTETARRAAVHLQCIPGEDPTILAGLIHLIIAMGAVDTPFVAHNAQGLDGLAEAVKDFTPAYVAERAGVDEGDLREAARIIATARRGDFGAGTGPSMATRGTLMAYLLYCLQTLRGFWAREGDAAVMPRVLFPPQEFRAEPIPPYPAWGFGERMRVRGLEQTAAGMPTGALPEEILTPGEGQIRALFLHGGAMRTWPDEALVKRALTDLELLVVHDVELSATSAMAHYIIATKLPFEVPVMSQINELLSLFHPGYGWVEPYGAYQPALLDPPADCDLLEPWQIYYRVARRLGLALEYPSFHDLLGIAAKDTAGAGAPLKRTLDMDREPSTDELYEMMCEGSAVPLSRVKQYPSGHLFDEARRRVGPRDADCAARLELANPAMLAELAEVRGENVAARRGTDGEYPFLFISRRIQNSTNAVSSTDRSVLAKPYNPAYMNPGDLAALGLGPGDRVEIRSRHGAIIGLVEPEADLRPGVLSMPHGFGPPPGEGEDPARHGANVNRLISWRDDFDPHNGMPRMSAIPVSVRPAP